ncbi:hypothetical protein E2C01_033657 [Portunus trituberculatus]|uniref:Uncharacterized protein n=1 Tax=Portunus trituberculatus TaxID=210409 RepID=A0A5B7F4T2_PORTR|nr:hypothetical protein [Portunus trituberculatus]
MNRSWGGGDVWARHCCEAEGRGVWGKENHHRSWRGMLSDEWQQQSLELEKRVWSLENLYCLANVT